MLTVANLNKNFGKKSVLKGISCTLTPGVYGLLGPNGAGKTTLMRCITGLYPCPEGTLLYGDRPIQKDRDYLSRVGYLPQKFGMFRDLTVYGALELISSLKGLPRAGTDADIRRCVELVNLTEKLSARVRTLSGGMLRRLGVAQALLGDPDLLIFDEPTAGLDPEERLRFKLILANLHKDRIILISTHIVSDVEAICDRVLVMNEGRIVLSGSREDLRRRGEGKVWLAPQRDMDRAAGQSYVQGQYDRDGEVYLRILSAQAQPFEPAEPTLEDGYICVLKGI